MLDGLHTMDLIERTEAAMAAGKRVKHKEQFEEFDRRELAAMDDKALAKWQSQFQTDEPQWRLAEHEWQRRLTAEQIRATLTSARWQAWFGIAAAVIGALLGALLTLGIQFLAR